jgi:adenine-specific DNA methylase
MDFKTEQTEQKLRGGYYTPNDLAQFMSRWILNSGAKKILEPSSGDGNFFKSISNVNSSSNLKIEIIGIELNSDEAKKSIKRVRELKNITVDVHNTDFLEWGLMNYNNLRFDAVTGNPPFIRYQYLPKEYQLKAEKIFKLFNLKFTRHTNAWVPFVVLGFELLKPGGKLAMILPSEIMHVAHAQSLRTYLGKNSKKILILDPKELWFTDTLQGALILLAEKKNNTDEHSLGLGIKEVNNRAFSKKDPRNYFDKVHFINGETIKGKWTKAVLNSKELSLVKEIKKDTRVQQFKNIASVDVGLVTGANKYFLISEDDVKKHGLEKWAHPMFGRSNHCPKMVYDSKQHQLNIEEGRPTNFIWFDVESYDELDKNAKKYVEIGENEEYHERYKCRVREPWFRVPSVYATEIGMLKRAHNFPRLILNKKRAYTTDTAYRIRVIDNEIKSYELVFNFLNSFTALTAELEGRFYGGGVLELVPSEIEKTFIPNVTINESYLNELDEDFQELSAQKVLKRQDDIILKKIGLNKKERRIIHNAWFKLRNRRQRN